MFVLRKGKVNRYSSRNKAGASSCFVELPILFSLIFWDIGKDKSSLSSSNVMFMMLKKMIYMLLLNIHKFNDLRQHDPSFYQIEIDFFISVSQMVSENINHIYCLQVDKWNITLEELPDLPAKFGPSFPADGLWVGCRTQCRRSSACLCNRPTSLPLFLFLSFSILDTLK